MASTSVPSLYEWVGGMQALNRLMARFYQRVRDNAVLGPVFAQMGSEHPQHVAAFLAEVLPKWGWGEVKGPYVPGS